MADAVLANPYIGPTAFTEDDSERFFGRAEETRELTSLVIARRAVLLYAQSGSGKTSLLQASLIPELKRRKRVETFPISRVTGSADPAGCLYVENALANLFPDAPAGSFRSKTFSEAFGAVLAADTKARRQARLVIFDQFEEIFTYHPELTDQRHAFFVQLGDCLSEYPQLSLLLSMREDYLADLEASAALLPDRMRTRMRLERLGVEGAVDAVREPAALAGMPFAPGIAEQLVDNLRRIRTGSAGSNGFALGLYVEPVQLQIVCRQLWSRVTADPAHRKTEIDAADLAAHANVDDALIQFYRDSLAKAQQAGVRERALRRWFGERLITPVGTRGLVYRGERETEGLPNSAVDILRDCYIIRAELRGGNVWYELAHDRLVEPVREDNLAWKAGYRNPVAEALERNSDILLTGSGLVAAQQFARDNPQELTQEERQFLKRSEEAEKKGRALRRTLIGSAAAVIVVLSILAAYAFRQAQSAKASAAEAGRQRVKAEEQSKASARLADAERAARSDAQRQADLANSGRLAASSLLNKDDRQDLAALLSIEGNRAADSFETRNSLLRSLESNVRLIAILNLYGPGVQTVTFSPSGKTLALASIDGWVRLWDVRSRKPLGDLLEANGVQSLAFSPDGQILASASSNGTVRLWDMASRKKLDLPLEGMSGSVHGVAFSPNGKLLALACFDHNVRLLDLASRRLLGDPLNGHSDSVESVAFSQDGKILASGSNDKTVRLWDVASRQPLGDPLQGHSAGVKSVAFSPNGKILASGSDDKTLRLWDVASRQPLGDLRAPLGAHSASVESVAFSPDGKILVSGSYDRTVQIWDVASRRPLEAPLKGHSDAVYGVAFSPSGNMLASASHDGTVRLWDMAPRQPLSDLLEANAVNSIAFSPDGNILASASDDKTVQLWDVPHRQPLGKPLEGHSDWVMSVAFSPDGKTLASASLDGTVWLWDVSRRRTLGDPLKSDIGAVMSVAFSPDGKVLALAGSDQKVRLWNLPSRQPLGDPLKGHEGPVIGVAFSPDGTTLASAGFDRTVRLWDVMRRQPLGSPLTGHYDSVFSVAFSPDGRILASADDDKTVRLWDVASRQPLGDPLFGVRSVAFSVDGKLLASTNNDHTVSLWDVARREPLGEPLRGHDQLVLSVAFNPDGNMLASASFDGSVRLWDIDPNSWIHRVCRMANRNLTLAEWQQFFGLKTAYARTCPNLPPGEGAPAK
jgi:WD40 repeat protein